MCWKKDNVSRLAAALSYYMIFSIAPLLIICISVAGIFFKKDLFQIYILNQITDLIGVDSAHQVELMIHSIANKNHTNLSATIIGIIILFFGAIGIFTELQNGLNTIWGSKTVKNSWLMQMKSYFLSIIMFLIFSFTVIFSFLVNTYLIIAYHAIYKILPFSISYLFIINSLFLFIVITALLALTFKYLPEAELEWNDVWLASVLTAILFIIGKFILDLYFSKIDLKIAYGPAASFIMILIWVYYSSHILFLGAEFIKNRILEKEEQK